MSSNDLHSLNKQYAIPGHVEFVRSKGDLPAVRIDNASASATVVLHGAQVIAFQPRGSEPVLWMSAKSRFQHGMPIRGGIPVCWPWFGPHPEDPGKPAHGFARISPWDVVATEAPADGVTLLELKLADSQETRRLWPYAFELRLQIRISAALEVALIMCNKGENPMRCTSALHSYFAVSDISTVRIRGLEKCRFVDTAASPPAEGIEDQPIAFRGETDRVYFDTLADCVIDDPGCRRRIRISKDGSRSTVVWNPWITKSARMPDFGDEEWRGMVCIETTNALTDVREIEPGGSHRLATMIGVESDQH
jgi:D-hexose-6-phosphate mutarotase